jgi:hypothetical protein
LAVFLPAGKVPEIWEISALLRFDCLNAAIIAIKKFTRTVFVLQQHQPTPIRRKLSVLLDEVFRR